MGLAKGLRLGLAGITGALQAGAEVVEAQEKTEDVYTLTAVKNSIAQRKAIAKEARKDYENQRELQDKVSNYSGNVYAIDKSTGKERPLTPVEIEALITTIGEEDFKKYAMEKGGLILKGGAKAIRTEVDLAESMEETAKEVKGLVGEGRGIAKGQEARITKKVENQLAKLNLASDPTKVTRTKYEGLEFSIRDQQELDSNRGKDYTFTGEINGQKVNNITGYVGKDGLYYINDLRVLKEDQKPIRATGDKYSSPVEVFKPSEPVSQADAIAFFDRRLENSGHEKLRSEIVQKSISVQNLSKRLGDMWEIAQNNEVFSKTVLFTGALSKRIDVEIGGIKFLFDPTDDSETSANKNATKKAQLDEFISNNRSAQDAATKKKVLDAMIFSTAMEQATDGQSNPSDKDLAGQLKQLESSNPKEFFMKARQMWSDKSSDLKNSYNTYTNNNPMDIDVSNWPPAYQQAKNVMMQGKEIRSEEIDIAPPTFFTTTNMKDLETAKQEEEKPAKAVQFNKQIEIGGQAMSFDISIDGTGPDAKVTFTGPSGSKTYTLKQAMEQGYITAEDIK